MSTTRRDFIRANAVAAASAAAGIGTTATAKNLITTDTKLKWAKAACRFCGTGCGVNVATRDNKVVATHGDINSPVNRGLACVKGYFLIFWGGFNTAMEFTNSDAFCTGCHEMNDNVYQELQSTIHFTNRSGVRALCSDCHVPHAWTYKIARKMQASKEVWGKIFGTIDTREKFLAKRRELAEHEWARLKANDSLDCRNCHDLEYMDLTWQSQRAAQQHSTALASGEKTCIDCHKGIAHQLPDMAGVEGWD